MQALSRPERFIARVRAHVAGLSSDAQRREFLAVQHAHWERLYSAFIAKVDAGRDPGSATAFEFTETIAALEIELAKYERKAA